MDNKYQEVLQRIFNRAYLGLKSQGFRKSLDEPWKETDSCAYRGQNGLRCAIGHCIPDEKYTPKIEGKAAHLTFYYLDDDLLSGINEIEFVDHIAHPMDDLQEAHDESSSPEDMKLLLERFAGNHGLSIPKGG